MLLCWHRAIVTAITWIIVNWVLDVIALLPFTHQICRNSSWRSASNIWECSDRCVRWDSCSKERQRVRHHSHGKNKLQSAGAQRVHVASF